MNACVEMAWASRNSITIWSLCDANEITSGFVDNATDVWIEGNVGTKPMFLWNFLSLVLQVRQQFLHGIVFVSSAISPTNNYGCALAYQFGMLKQFRFKIHTTTQSYLKRKTWLANLHDRNKWKLCVRVQTSAGLSTYTHIHRFLSYQHKSHFFSFSISNTFREVRIEYW